MRKTHLYIAGLLFTTAMAACDAGTGTGSTSDSTAILAGDSAVTTRTTVTTVHHKYSGSFNPQPEIKYLDLRTQQQVTVRIDTVLGEVVNNETNEPLDLFVDPIKHDTIYGMTGAVVNNYIIKDQGGYRVDTVRINTVEVQTVAATPGGDLPENSKYKQKDNKTKLKTDDVKVKIKNGVVKVKER